MKHPSFVGSAARLLLIASFATLVHGRGAAVEAEPVIPVLTPSDVVNWMAPMRVENGRLGIDWSSIGLIEKRHAGVVNGKSMLDSDVRFVVSAARAGAINPPKFEVVLHIEGGSIASKSGDARDLPISVGITEKNDKDAKGALRGEFNTLGRLSSNGEMYDASEMTLNLDSATCLALYSMNRKTREFRLKFKEERILKEDLFVELANNILIVHVSNTDVGSGFDFTQKPNGEAELTYNDGEIKRMVNAAGFHELVQKNTAEMQANFFKPLSEAGVRIALCPDLPVVMAAATTGFSEPLPENVKKADALIGAVAAAPTPEQRAKAVTDLTRFFPQAIQHISQAAEKTADPNLKAALQKAIAAHPGIARALPFVQTHKLQDDREYLFDIFEHVALLKDAAHARLAVVIGKDYGDDPDAWRK